MAAIQREPSQGYTHEGVKRRRTPTYLKALGRHDPPCSIVLADETYVLRRVFKHDFFAATALYEGNGRKVVLKIGRQADFFGWPMEWIGRYLANHEKEAYRRLAGLAGIPKFRGRWGPTGIVHDYVEGRPLQKGQPAPDWFFAELRDRVLDIHQRGMAYVDLEKPENVILGDDGHAYLIDFQISCYWPWNWGRDSAVAQWIVRRFQIGDLYHVGKLHRRIRPDQLSADELSRTYEIPKAVQFHRRYIRPLTHLRRWVLEGIDPRRGKGERGSIRD